VGRKKGSNKHRERKIRIDLRRNRAERTRDQGEFTRLVRAGDDRQEETESAENVRAKGELSRKRTIVLHDEKPGAGRVHRGLVVAMRGRIAEVDDGEQLWACTVRRLLLTRLIKERHPLAVGDDVRFAPGEEGRIVIDDRELPEGVIEEAAPRRTTLLREYGRRLHVVAANVDQAVIVMAADMPPLRPHLIDRYLVAAQMGNMQPVVCVNKADLDEGGAAAAVVDRYARLGYPSLLTSVVEPRGLDRLQELLTDRTSVLFGPSGAGKSSLLNALDPRLSLKVGTLSDLDRGRHTTTTARLLKWAFGGYVVDTPGLRQFDVPNVAPAQLPGLFVELAELAGQCRFLDCSHRHEEACAVKAALEAGRISSERYESYCKMYEECAAKPKY
jgi:ribosome biogenesis GTPase